jgi:hypothetical protein
VKEEERERVVDGGWSVGVNGSSEQVQYSTVQYSAMTKVWRSRRSGKLQMAVAVSRSPSPEKGSLECMPSKFVQLRDGGEVVRHAVQVQS